MPADLGSTSWSEIDASNDATPPNGWPEGMFPSDVNNSARAQMGGEKRWWDRSNATQTTTGTSTAYVLTYASTESALYNGEETSFVLHATCGANPTLNRDGLGAKYLRKYDFATQAYIAVSAGDIIVNQVLRVRYNLADDRYDIISGNVDPIFGTAGGSLAGTYPNPTLATARVSQVKIVPITSTGTYTPTSGMLYCIIECVAPGGGGGGVTGNIGWIVESAGGGSGGYARLLASAATIGASKAVTIGTAGAGGAAGSNNGADGGDVSVGSLCIAKGGKGGGYSQAGVQVGTGGLGGVAGTGDLTPTGTPGGSGWVLNTVNGTARGSVGGSSYLGGGALQSIRTSSGATAGAAATNYGGGGGGACALDTASTAAGGNAGPGIVIITEYIGTT